MTGTKRYRVTKLAGEWVAGHRVKPDQILELTPKQAKYELILGTLIDADASEPLNEQQGSPPRKGRRGGSAAAAPAAPKEE